MMQKTYSPKPDDVHNSRPGMSWTARKASHSGGWRPRSLRCCAASTNRNFAPHLDVGDFVVVVNADKVAVTSSKSERKIYYRHSGFPGGLKEESFASLIERRPEQVVERAVRGMLPKNRLGRQMLKKLKVHAGANHPHEAQSPQPLVFDIRKVDA